MTRKDYIVIAGALNAAWHNADKADKPGIVQAAGYVASGLAADNYRFDRDKFMDAVYA